jgi:TRAP-type uncharacterized transport system fused permease subunit
VNTISFSLYGPDAFGLVHRRLLDRGAIHKAQVQADERDRFCSVQEMFEVRFSYMLLSIADNNVLIALIFAMFISIILGMGMPTTAAYAVAASVVAPGLIRMEIDPLFAHMFVFYYAVISAITPPVALAAYAAAGISGSDPMRTGVQSFKLGLAAFIVPFMFFYSPQLLLDGDSVGQIVFVSITAAAGIYLLAAGVQGWFFGKKANSLIRLVLFGGAILLIMADLKLI